MKVEKHIEFLKLVMEILNSLCTDAGIGKEKKLRSDALLHEQRKVFRIILQEIVPARIKRRIKPMKEYKETVHSLIYKSNSDLSLYSAGYEDCAPGYHYGPRYRAYDLIHFVCRGQGKLQLNEHIFELSAGDAFIIPQGKVSYYEASQTDPWSYAWISYLGISSQIYTYQLLTSSEDVYILHGLDTEKYKAVITKIISLRGHTTSDYLRANSCLLAVLSMLFADVGFNEKSWGAVSAADEAKFYLDTNYSEKIVIKDLAKSLGVHPNYLSRIFSEKFGCSPKQYLMQLKLKKACRLLMTTELPVAVISNSLGFDDQLAFSKLFKKEMSMSPTEYRKKSRPGEF